MSMFRKLMNDEAGATAIEYGLIAALISVAAITAFTTIGTNLSTVMDKVGTNIKLPAG